MAIRIPEGKVFVPKAPGRAAELLAAADNLDEADRVLGIRTTAGGYHVDQAIAEEWLKGQPEGTEVLSEGGDKSDPANQTGTEAVQRAAADENGGETPIEIPDGDPAASWNHDQLNAWQADPKLNTKGVEWDADAKKADKLALIADAAK